MSDWNVFNLGHVVVVGFSVCLDDLSFCEQSYRKVLSSYLTSARQMFGLDILSDLFALHCLIVLAGLDSIDSGEISKVIASAASRRTSHASSIMPSIVPYAFTGYYKRTIEATTCFTLSSFQRTMKGRICPLFTTCLTRPFQMPSSTIKLSLWMMPAPTERLKSLKPYKSHMERTRSQSYLAKANWDWEVPMLAGLKEAKGNRIILMDADMSHHPKFIPQMVALMDSTKADIVTGTRYRPGGGVAGWDTFRKLTSKGANFLADFFMNPGVSDLTGSFRLYERNAIETVLPLVQSKGYAFQMEIVVRAKQLGLKIEEVPITFVDRIYGQSKLGTKEIILYLKGLMTLFFTT